MKDTSAARSTLKVSGNAVGRASDGETRSGGYILSVEKIRVVIAEDHDAFRAGIRRLLSAQADIEVVGEVRNGSEAYDIVFKARPALIVMDLDMPIEDGASAGRRILALLPLAIIVIVSANDPEEGKRVATEIGAAAFVAKHECAALLVSTIRGQVADRRNALGGAPTSVERRATWCKAARFGPLSS